MSRHPATSAPTSFTSDTPTSARLYAELFPEVYLRFHRRDGKTRELSAASRAVLLHLARTGPLSVGECAKHFERAQSAVSELVEQLETNGLVARVRDETDRRRVLVWLSEQGRAQLVQDQQVLSSELVERAMALMTDADRRQLIHATRALVRAADMASDEHVSHPQSKE
jgi:DNA-binding MarR family transcriptional regulator